MLAPPAPNLGTIDGIPAHELLEGLGKLHQSVAVTRDDGTVLWVSRALEDRVAAQLQPIGSSLALLCQHLCRQYVQSHSDGRSSETSSNAPLEAVDEKLRAQVSDVLSQLEQRECVCHHAIRPNTQPDASSEIPETGIEISAFSVHCRGPEAHPHDELLYVAILRSPVKADLNETVDSATHSFSRNVLDQLPEATLTIDQSGFITYANGRTVALLGKSVSELIDTPVSLYFPRSAIVPLNSSEADKPDASGSNRDAPNRTVVELVPPDGSAIYVEVASRDLALPDGTHAGRILQLRDTSNQRRVIERFKQKVASLEAYVHTVSHDLRSPLVSMLGFTRLMKQDYGKLLDETGRRFLDRIEQAGSNMNIMTQDLLELSTREQQGTPTTPVDPRAILVQIQSEMKPRLEEQGVRLVLPTLPPMIQCDRTQLYQIFSNLIGNALTHMGPCKDPRIEIDIEEHDDERVIVVQDNGRGIEASEHERIFEAFHSNSPEDGARSTGVGLAIVKKIAKAHSGQAWVESEPGKGAAFFVSLAHR